MRPRRPHRQHTIVPNPNSAFNKAKAARKAKAAAKAQVPFDTRTKKQKLGKGQVAPIGSSSGNGSNRNGGKAMQFCEKLDQVLLVGEGDLSFTKALLKPPFAHPSGRITATVYDSKEDLLAKYPDTVEENIKFIEESTGAEAESDAEDKDSESDDFSDFSDFENDGEESQDKSGGFKDEKEPAKILYNVDATALSKTKYLRKRKFDCCVFNFPHTGSGITDQDRNIRQNQELLVGFFKSVTPLLTPTGVVVVTLFEGLPYSLWNLKDIAKALDFELVRSGRFVWEAYEGYTHRRTSGMGDTTKKFDQREARMYIFKIRDKNGPSKKQQQLASRNKKLERLKGKKRKRSGPESSDDSSDSD
ncbi:hypothetical protein BZA70DRAFT_295313 [Myxozyma melibiosi]|uniref:25S rRNA (uridine-N(3))-methyltransferase BMT5-like domain-containing protein n=1 Tax=Myxozyma melibiosi TaxID=54550 RepID=A0ABR1F6R3_9ASCO